MDKYQKALSSIKKSLLEETLCLGGKRQIYNRFAYWIHLEDIQITNPISILGNLELESDKISGSLADLISTQCNGDIDEAIQYIDNIIKHLPSPASSELNELPHLQNISILLRDIRAAINQSLTRPERKFDTHLSRTLSTPVGPSVPGLVMSGFCTLCHRATIQEKNYYCSKHFRPSGKESDIKKARRVIENAFENLDLGKTLIIKNEENNGTSREVFRQKSRLLLGWAKHKQEHLDYKSKLMIIFNEHQDIDAKHWPSDSIPMVRKIATLSNKIDHTKNHFNPFVILSTDIDKLINQLKLEVFDLDEDTELDIQLAKKMLIRKSQFSLIKLAASKKSIGQLL